MGAANNTLKVCAPMIMLGTISTPTFARAGKNFAHEVAMAQRYYEKTNPLDVTPGNVAGGNASIGRTSDTAGNYNGTNPLNLPYRVIKRNYPTVTVYAAGTGTANAVRLNNSSDHTGGNLNGDMAGFIYFIAVPTGGTVVGNYVAFFWAADAEL